LSSFNITGSISSDVSSNAEQFNVIRRNVDANSQTRTEISQNAATEKRRFLSKQTRLRDRNNNRCVLLIITATLLSKPAKI